MPGFSAIDLTPQAAGYAADLTFAEARQAESFFMVLKANFKGDVPKMANVLHSMGEMLLEHAEEQGDVQ